MTNDELAALLEEAANRLRGVMSIQCSSGGAGLAVSENDGGQMLGICGRSFRKLGIPSFKVGRLTRYRIADIERYVRKQSEGQS